MGERKISGARYAFVLVAGAALFFAGAFVGEKRRPAIEKVDGLANKEEGMPVAGVDFAPFWKAWNILNEKYEEIGANDKESCSLLLIMMLLKEGGTGIGVLKEGIFFDGKYQMIRKALVENFNVKYVISIPSDQFENTTTKTSIVFFENTKEKTKTVIFYDLIIKREEKRKYLVIFIHFKNRLLCTNKVMIEKIAIGIAIKNIDSLNFFKK